MESVDKLLGFFIDYGYFFLFLATALENIPVVGVFLPGELIVVAAGFLAASGEFNIAMVIVIACFGAMTGTTISYLIGYRGGRAVIEAIAKKLKMDGDKLDKADKYFSTHGPITVFVGRYLTGVKAFIPALAGTHRMSFPRFFAFGAIGIISWTILAGLLGYFFGSNWITLIKVIQTTGWIIAIMATLIFILIWYRRRN